MWVTDWGSVEGDTRLMIVVVFSSLITVASGSVADGNWFAVDPDRYKV
jgi:hypothetical protein